MIKTWLIATLLVVSNVSFAEDAKEKRPKVDADGWHFIKEKDGVEAFKKKPEGSKLFMFKSVGVIEAPIDRVLSVVIDADTAKDWIPKLMECEIRDYSTYPDTFLQYSKYNVPWPMKDRVFLSDVAITVDPNTHKTVISYKNTELDLEYDEKKLVQGFIGGSTYTLEPTGDGFTRFTAISVVDPKGGIPKWLVNWVGESMPFDTMKRLRKRLANENLAIDERLGALYR